MNPVDCATGENVCDCARVPATVMYSVQIGPETVDPSVRNRTLANVSIFFYCGGAARLTSVLELESLGVGVDNCGIPTCGCVVSDDPSISASYNRGPTGEKKGKKEIE